MDFSSYVVAGVRLVLVVLGLVEWVKSLGLQGNAVKFVSMGIGLILGVGYQLSVAVPIGFTGWFGACVFGLALGLLASGIYDAVKNATKQL
jgi:hypothetical protein